MLDRRDSIPYTEEDGLESAMRESIESLRWWDVYDEYV